MPDRLTMLFSNFASSILVADIDELDTQLPLRAGDGVRYPSPTPGVSFFMVVIEATDGNAEVCRCDSRVGDTLTVVRGLEGTSGNPFSAGTRVECRVTAGVLQGFMQVGDPRTDREVIADGFRGAYLNNPLGENEHRITMPDGAAPYLGIDQTHGRLLNYDDLPVGMIALWHGTVNSIPSRWQLCDGSNGTDDLSGFFILAAGNVGEGDRLQPGFRKEARGTVTAPVPAHNHGGTNNTALTEAQLPIVRLTIPGGGASAGNPSGYSSVNTIRNDAQQTLQFGGGLGHHHSINNDGEYSGGIPVPDVTPAYFAKAYIQKVA